MSEDQGGPRGETALGIERLALLEKVLDLPPGDRQKALAEADPELADDVRRRLEAFDLKGEDFLSPVASEALAVEAPPMPETIGAYHLLGLLGEGGMGRVYLAEQKEPVARRVALKVLPFAARGRSTARFEVERHAMGRLEHPNIGKILDGGATPEGLPFFAMELIEGQPVTTYCEQRSLALEERLRIFVEICRGVDHAHRKMLLHRDLKPSNILVTEVDGRPVPKIIDFGIAKGLDDSLASIAQATRGGLVGTPAYMSPEALQGDRDPDVRSDIYSLGVLLYELLTGKRPWKEEEETPHGALRRSSEDGIARPSSRAGPVDRGSLGGDLDWITLRALAAEPSDRYGSAAELAADIERFLSSEPVTARAPTAGYLLRKLARRHRGRVIAVVAVLLTLVLGIVGTTLGFLRARAETERANAEARDARQARDLAISAQQNSDQLADFFVDLFTARDGSLDSSTFTAAELLQRGMETSSQRLVDQPVARAALLQRVGGIFADWGDFERADTLLSEALALLESAGSSDGADSELLDVLEKSISVRWKQGRHSDAAELTDRALEMIDTLDDPDPIRVARILSQSALSALFQGRKKDPDIWLRRSDALLREASQTSPSHAPTLGVTRIGSGYLASLRKQHAEALAHFEAAAELFEGALGPEHVRLIVVYKFIGAELMHLGRSAEAEAALRRSLELGQRYFTDDGIRTTDSLSFLGQVMRERGDFERAEPLLRQSLSLRRQHLPPDHSLVAHDLAQLGWALWSADPSRSGEGVELLREAFEILDRRHDKTYPEYLQATGWLGLVRLEQGRYTEASTIFEKQCEFLQGLDEPHPLDSGQCRLGLGRSLISMEQTREGRLELEKALDHFESGGATEKAAEVRALLEIRSGPGAASVD